MDDVDASLWERFVTQNIYIQNLRLWLPVIPIGVDWHCKHLITSVFLLDGEPAQESINSSRLVLSENEAGISNGSLLINPVMKSDSGNYMCLISQYSIQLNTTTEVRVKGMCLNDSYASDS